ncbi:hypothetical protein PVAP13_6KG397201 [Panicum virgatum]|uniref:Uncharacterized protein n=1 Tax=Panicum virgatum TaxID=38727 RepID=A0A8T0RHR4_PANVG|nr:hypothetical protein PVAP13_6KG397201 [Panicum virgatum]
MILVRSTAAMLHCRLWIRRRPIINITLRPTKANSAQLPTFAQLLSLPGFFLKKKTAFASRHQRRRPNSTAKPSSLTASGHRTEEDELRQRRRGQRCWQRPWLGAALCGCARKDGDNRSAGGCSSSSQQQRAAAEQQARVQQQPRVQQPPAERQQRGRSSRKQRKSDQPNTVGKRLSASMPLGKQCFEA